MSQPRRFRHLDTLINIFVVVLMISNLVGQKICAFGDVRISGAQLLFPITYIFGDIFTEVYGYGASRRAIWTGFLASALLAAMGMISVALPPAPEWGGQAAFATVFGFVPRLVVASLIAYWCGEFVNAFVMAKMKLITKSKFLWMRTIGSTVAGQAVDTIVVIVIAFAGTASPSSMVAMIVSGYFGKVLYETVMTPVTYAVVNGLKRSEGIDVLDEGTDFNPFHRDKGEPPPRAMANSAGDR